MSPRLSQLINSIIPGSHIKDLVIGEIFGNLIERNDPDGLIYAHSLTSLYAAHRLARGHATVHFFPCTPRVRYTEGKPHFIRVSPKSLKKSLNLLSDVKSTLRSVVAIGLRNAENARWWTERFNLENQEQIYVKNAWAFNPRRLEKSLNTKNVTKQVSTTATLIVDARNMRQAPIFQVAKTLSRVHPSLQLIAITDTDEEISKINLLVSEIDQLDLRIIDRRHLTKRARYKYLFNGLFFRKKTKSPTMAERHLKDNDFLTDEEDNTLTDALQNYAPKIVRQKQFNQKSLPEKIKHFSDNTIEFTKAQVYDLVLSFDVISAPTGYEISRILQCQHVVDFNETPIFEERIGRAFKSLSSPQRKTLYKTCFKATSNCDFNISPSHQLGTRAADKFKTNVIPIRSFHGEIDLIDIPGPRDEFSIPETALVLVHCCTYAEKYGSSLLIDVMTHLPEEHHLIMVGNADGADYDHLFKKQVKDAGLANRIHFKPNIDGVQNYLSYMSKGDLGVILLDNQIATVRDGLANRFVDLLGAGLPMISTHAFESTKIINDWNIGQIVYGLDPKTFARQILNLGGDKLKSPELKSRVMAARAELSWDKEIDRFFTMIKRSGGKKACFVFQRGLVRNKRILRLANELTLRGWDVNCLSGVRPPDKVQENYPDINFNRIPSNRPWREGECAHEHEYNENKRLLDLYFSEQTPQSGDI